MELDKLLKQKRSTMHLTQEQLALKLFVSPKTVSNWETGKTFPDIESLINLCQLYHLSLDKLLIKGTNLVDDYKETEILAEITRKRRIQFGGPILSSTLLCLLFMGNIIWPALVKMNLTVQIVILAAMLGNIVSTYYFDQQIKHIKQR